MNILIEDKKELKRLWFIYGNNGIKSTPSNHHFIQSFIENLDIRMKHYKSFKEYFYGIKSFYKIRKNNELYNLVYEILKKYF